MVKGIVLSIGISLLMSCSKNSTSNNGSNTDVLHMSFKTPDWERDVNCNELSFDPNMINDSTSLANWQSASTDAYFYVTFPLDSSKMNQVSNLKRYTIKNYGENNAPFQFSEKLPIDANSLNDYTRKLVSDEGFNASSYNEVQEIKYLESDNQYATFIVKCSYMLLSHHAGVTPLEIKPVSGSYALKIKTRKR